MYKEKTERKGKNIYPRSSKVDRAKRIKENHDESEKKR